MMLGSSRPAPTVSSGTRPARGWVRGLVLVAVVLVLVGVFLAYRSPHLAVDLANRVWSCF